MKTTLFFLALGLSVPFASASQSLRASSGTAATAPGKVMLLAAADSETTEEPKANQKGKGKAKGKAKGHNKEKGETVDATATTQPASNTAAVTTQTTPPTTTTQPVPAPTQAPHATTTSSAQSSSTAPVTNPKSRTAAEINADLTRHARQINELDNNPAAAKAGLKAIAAETGVSATTLQKQFTEQKIGSAGLLIGHEIAKASGKPAKTVFAQHAQKRDWTQIAAANKVDLKPLLPKLERVHEAMAAAAQAQKKR